MYDLPTRNNYGGVAMLVHRNFGELNERHDLKLYNPVTVMIVALKIYGVNWS